jgi:hypothetical protein
MTFFKNPGDALLIIIIFGVVTLIISIFDLLARKFHENRIFKYIVTFYLIYSIFLIISGAILLFARIEIPQILIIIILITCLPAVLINRLLW